MDADISLEVTYVAFVIIRQIEQIELIGQPKDA